MNNAILVFICLSFSCSGQSLSDYSQPYKFSDSILHHLASNASKNKYQHSAWELSNIGDYKRTLAIWDSGSIKFPSISKNDSFYFLKFHPLNAHDYIIERAKKEKIIIINEAHQQPYHRVFTESLLPDLYRLGYRYFGAEAISQMDEQLNDRKYPVKATGILVQQPQYGNLVRTALQEGFYVFGYEADFSANPNMTSKEREIEQAKNIKLILDKNPEAKIIIHCGFDHIVESALPGWEKAMAGKLKEYTGIDPFTIDQVKLTEASSADYENPYFKMVNLNYYAVFIDSANKLFNGPQMFNEYDARVYHPRTEMINGRPGWVFENKRYPYFINNKITISFPCLVLAYYANEDSSTAIPADVIELKNKDEKIALSLKKGLYNIVIKNENGDRQTFEVKAPD